MKRYAFLQRMIKGRIALDEPLDRHTSFGIGGPAEALVFPIDGEDLQRVLTFVNERHLPLLVLGNGTNVLISDAGFPGVVIRLSEGFKGINRQDEEITAGAGLDLNEMVEFCVSNRLTGLEFCAGIPGTVGGAVWGNAGSQGREMGHVVRYVEGMNRDGSPARLERSSIPFSYRRSGLPRSLVITRIQFSLTQGHEKAIQEAIEANLNRRRERHPWKERSAGCIFKNPPQRSAGQLIDSAGCKGMTVGGAQVSTMHANFIVNAGGATAADVLDLIDQVRQRVQRRWRILLELEIQVIRGDTCSNN